MPSIKDHQSSQTTKLLLIGESGTGKTGALASLAAAGYNLRILDIDNGVDILRDLTSGRNAKYPAASAERIEFMTFNEKYKAAGGSLFPVTGDVWEKTVKQIDNWVDGEKKYGSILTWTPQDVLVVDSLTKLAEAAYNYILKLNAKLISGAEGYERLRFIEQAQAKVESFVEMITAEQVKCNVVVISHIVYVDEPGLIRTSPDEKLPQMGVPSSLGKALSPRIPRRFNSTLMIRKVGLNHKIFTKTHSNINLKTSAPTIVKAEYGIETGLADYFKDVRSVSA